MTDQLFTYWRPKDSRGRVHSFYVKMQDGKSGCRRLIDRTKWEQLTVDEAADEMMCQSCAMTEMMIFVTLARREGAA